MAKELQAAYITGKTLYAQVRSLTGTIWNGSAFETYLTANIANYKIALNEQGTASAYYTGNMPAAVPGYYNLVCYRQIGGSAAEGDTLVAQGWIHWMGTELASVPSSTPSPAEAIQFLYQALRNKTTVTATNQTLANDAGTTTATSTLTDDGTTFTRDKFG